MSFRPFHFVSIILLSLLAFQNNYSFSQQRFSLTISNQASFKTLHATRKAFKDSVELIQYLKEIRWNAIKKGYLMASCDSAYWTQKECRIYFYEGPKFGNIHLTPEFIGKEVGNARSFIQPREIRNIPFRPNELQRLLENIESAYLDHGFPFCKTSLAELHWKENAELYGKLIVKAGDSYRFNKIIIKGDSSISDVFISSLLNIRSGDLFDESKLKSISGKITQIPFLKEVKPHELLFTDKGCELYLYLKSNPVSSANGTIGLQPNPITNRVGLAGELNLKLLNILKRGEQLNLNWRSIQDQTQSMQLKLNYPFLFKSPFGIDAQLQLYKKDSTFLEVKSMLGIQYFLRSGAYLKAFYQQYSNNLLNGTKNNNSFQNLSNVNSSSYGFSVSKRSLDYIPNPSKGYVFQLEAAVGTRKSKDSDSSLTERNTTCRFSFHTEWFMPVAKRHIVRFATYNEFYYAPSVFQNELYRFGGQMTLRGFNEDELVASSRSVTTIEYRFLLDRNSAVFIFYDQGYYENRALSYVRDHPYGFGAGLSFGTNLGIFSLSYALGSQQNNPILLKNGKIHFGYIAYF